MIDYILDSDQLSLFYRGHEPLRDRLLQMPPDAIGITVISIEEMIRGRFAQIRQATGSTQRVRAYHWLSETFVFLCGFTILEYTSQADEHFQALRSQKVRIGSQDLKIGSIALAEKAILVTANRRDFERIPNLAIENWTMSAR